MKELFHLVLEFYRAVCLSHRRLLPSFSLRYSWLFSLLVVRCKQWKGDRVVEETVSYLVRVQNVRWCSKYEPLLSHVTVIV